MISYNAYALKQSEPVAQPKTCGAWRRDIDHTRIKPATLERIDRVVELWANGRGMSARQIRDALGYKSDISIHAIVRRLKLPKRVKKTGMQ